MCSTTEPPVQKLGAHVAAIGFTFYTDTMFPASYKNAAIIAQHGSWNRSTPSGYRVIFSGRLFRIPVNADGNAGTMVAIETSHDRCEYGPMGCRTVVRSIS